ncbi:hypothetical protein FOZ61_001770 [Perkinsus olseni]|uniref:Uncharacterized protein n=1 Tax=Perkinsus olseni TaxID=32597 RepID=A0A7J6LVK1_PEROL|nr:hypothetical protein FOZ61_001770 [Perkinsus olseni]
MAWIHLAFSRGSSCGIQQRSKNTRQELDIRPKHESNPILDDNTRRISSDRVHSISDCGGDGEQRVQAW